MMNNAITHNLSIPSGLLITAGLSPAFIAQFVLFTGLVLLWTIVIGKILKHFFCLPVIAGRIIAGILLGPSFINLAGFSPFSQPLELFDCITKQAYFISASDVILFVILLISSAFTVSYLLWIAGHETDIKDIVLIGPVAVMAGILGALLPICMISGFLYFLLGGEWDIIRSLGMGLIFAATSVSIPIAMLVSYNKMHLRSSKAALGAAIVDDIFAVVLLALFSLTLGAGLFGSTQGMVLSSHTPSISYSLMAMFFGFLVMCIGGYFAMRPLLHWLNENRFAYMIAPLAQISMMFYFAFAEMIAGLAGITGAYFAGLFHRMGDHRHVALKAISPFVEAFLLPLFLGSIGLQLDMRLLDMYDWLLVLILLILAIVSKLMGCFLATAISNLLSKNNAHRWTGLESYIFGSSMIARGEVGLVVSTILFGSGILVVQHYIIAVVVIVLTTVATPIMLVQGFIKISQVKEKDTYTLSLGFFPTIGTNQMFTIISGKLEESGVYNTSVQMSEGSKIMNIEDQDVEIILTTDKGIFLKGNKQNITTILSFIKEEIRSDLEILGD